MRPDEELSLQEKNDFAAAVSMEVDVNAPEDTESLKREVESSAEILLSIAGEFIAEDKKESLRSIHKRMVYFDSCKEFLRYYNKYVRVGGYSDRRKAIGMYLPDYDQITVFNKEFVDSVEVGEEIWEALAKEEREELVGKFQDEESAKYFVSHYQVYEVLAHEVFHAAQKDIKGLDALALSECAARYFAREVLIKKGISFSFESDYHELDNKRIKLFETIVNKYGMENAYLSVFDPEKLDDAELSKIEAEMTHEVYEELFPHGNGL